MDLQAEHIDLSTPPDGLTLDDRIRWFAIKMDRDGSGYRPSTTTFRAWAEAVSGMRFDRDLAAKENDRLAARVRELEARAPPAPPPTLTDLAFAQQAAPGLAWQEGTLEAWAEIPTGRAIAGDGHATIGCLWVVVVVGGYNLRGDFTRPLTVAEARHVLHDHAQRLARSKLDYRRAAGLAILTGMEER